MKRHKYHYEFADFLTDTWYVEVEELKLSWSRCSPRDLKALTHRYFNAAHGASGIQYMEWRYQKWKAVTDYVFKNTQSFNMAAWGDERLGTRAQAGIAFSSDFRLRHPPQHQGCFGVSRAEIFSRRGRLKSRKT